MVPCEVREADDTRHLALKYIEVQPPFPSLHVQGLQQERADAVFFNERLQLSVRVASGVDAIQINLAHCVDQMRLCMTISDRCDIGDDELA